MCGINGTLSFDRSNFRVTAPFIDAMRDTMAHRGPTAAALGFRRMEEWD